MKSLYVAFAAASLGLSGCCGYAAVQPVAPEAPVAAETQESDALPPPPEVLADQGVGAVDVVASLPGFSRCYRRALAADPETSGYVRLDAALRADGSVAAVSPESETDLPEEVVRCSSAVLSRAQFAPPVSGTDTHVIVPLRFTPPPVSKR